MPRPKKYRKVGFLPKISRFGPLGKGHHNLEGIKLKIEELEAIRLKDLEGLSQEECGEKMEVSRQTFQNILESSRKKIADALIHGKRIDIEGGHYRHRNCKYRCSICGKFYNINIKKDEENCPKCGSKEVDCDKNKEICKRLCKNKE